MFVLKGDTATFDPFANMHEPEEARIEWFTQNGFSVRGVVHVGANDGKELAWYVTKNYRPILAFEPHPQAFLELKDHYWNHALLWNIALGDEDVTLKLNIPEDGDTEKSSRFVAIPTEGHDWTKIPVASQIQVPMRRFDSWAGEGGIDMSPFNTLVIDVQGMELEVLEGFGTYLGFFSLLSVECSKSPVYDGEYPADMIVDFLWDNDFKRLTPIEEHDDILFCRKGLVGAVSD